MVYRLVIVDHNTDVGPHLGNAGYELFLKVVHVLILVHHQIFDFGQVFPNVRIAFYLAQCLKNHQRKIDIFVVVKAFDILIQHGALFISPCIRVIKVINHFIDTLQKQLNIPWIRFKLQVAHTTFTAVPCDK